MIFDADKQQSFFSILMQSQETEQINVENVGLFTVPCLPVCSLRSILKSHGVLKIGHKNCFGAGSEEESSRPPLLHLHPPPKQFFYSPQVLAHRLTFEMAAKRTQRSNWTNTRENRGTVNTYMLLLLVAHPLSARPLRKPLLHLATPCICISASIHPPTF